MPRAWEGISMTNCVALLLLSWAIIAMLLVLNFSYRRFLDNGRKREAELIAQVEEVVAGWNKTIASLEQSNANTSMLLDEKRHAWGLPRVVIGAEKET